MGISFLWESHGKPPMGWDVTVINCYGIGMGLINMSHGQRRRFRQIYKEQYDSCTNPCTVDVRISYQHQLSVTMGVRINFSMGPQSRHVALSFLTMPRKWTCTKRFTLSTPPRKKRPNVTATAAYSVFPLRKFYTRQCLF